MRTSLKLATFAFLLFAVRLLFLTTDATNEIPLGEEVSQIVPGAKGARPRVGDQVSSLSRRVSWMLGPLEAASDFQSGADLITQSSQRISPAELKEALLLLENNVTSAAGDLRQVLTRRWAEIDAPSAGDWAAGRRADSAGFGAVIRQVALGWAASDSLAAARWAERLPDVEIRTDAVLAVAYQSADRFPLAALEIGGILPPSPCRDDLLEHAVSQWAYQDPSNALAWASRITGQDLQYRLVGAVALVMARNGEVAAAKAAVESIAPGEVQNRTMVGILQRCAYTSPEFARDLATQLPDPQSRVAGARILMASRKPSDPQTDSEPSRNSLRTANVR